VENKPVFLTEEEVLFLHPEALSRYGGMDGIRDISALKSAVGMPAASFGGEFLHRYPFGMAAAYAFHVAENQPFVDGNKRTAMACALMFLMQAGYSPSSPHRLYEAMIDVGNRRLTKEGLEQMFKKLCSEQ
jgi:death on curing protein